MDFSLELGQEVLSRTPSVLQSMLADISSEWTMASEEPGAWSPYQVVGHLTYIEESDWIDRTRVILEHGISRVFEPVDREAGFTRFGGWELSDLLIRFADVRRSNLTTLNALIDVADFERRGVHP